MESITLRKMRKQPPDRRIKTLRSRFYYRGDKLPYSMTQNISVAQAIEEMETMKQATGYYLTWQVKWCNA